MNDHSTTTTIGQVVSSARPDGECGISVLLTSSGFVTPGRLAADPPPSDAEDNDVLHLDLERDSSAPAAARRALADRFDQRLDPTVLDDAQLVVSELVSNAVVHGLGDSLTLHAESDDGSVTISVSSRCRVRDLRRGEPWELPDPTQIGGRGLPIVSSLSVTPPTVDSSPDGAWHNQLTITATLTATDVA